MVWCHKWYYFHRYCSHDSHINQQTVSSPSAHLCLRVCSLTAGKKILHFDWTSIITCFTSFLHATCGKFNMARSLDFCLLQAFATYSWYHFAVCSCLLVTQGKQPPAQKWPTLITAQLNTRIVITSVVQPSHNMYSKNEKKDDHNRQDGKGELKSCEW